MAAAKKSKLDKGHFEIVLDGKPHVLTPTLAAFNRLSALGAFSEVVPRIINRDAPTLAVIIRHGLGWKDAQAKGLAEIMFKTGTHELWEPCYNYFFALFSDGMTAEEVAAHNAEKAGEDDDEDADAGNALMGA